MTANNDQPAPKAETKAKLVERLLKARNGASLTELVEATGWQAHTRRAFLTGLRKKGKAPIRDKRKDGTTFYKLATAARTAEANKVAGEAGAEANASMARRNLTLDQLADLPIRDMKIEWARRYGAPTPNLSTDLLRLGISYKLQEQQQGGLHHTSRSFLRHSERAAGKGTPPRKSNARHQARPRLAWLRTHGHRAR